MDVIRITDKYHNHAAVDYAITFQVGRWLGAGAEQSTLQNSSRDVGAGAAGRNIIQNLQVGSSASRSSRNNIYNGSTSPGSKVIPTHRKCHSRGSCLQSYFVFAYPKCSASPGETCKKSSLFLTTIILRFSTRLVAFYYPTPI